MRKTTNFSRRSYRRKKHLREFEKSLKKMNWFYSVSVIIGCAIGGLFNSLEWLSKAEALDQVFMLLVVGVVLIVGALIYFYVD